MEKDKQFFEETFKTLDEVTRPTAEQKERIFKTILTDVRQHSDIQPTRSGYSLGKIVADYPWRFAFGAAFVQSSVCTLIFGTSYTHFIMSLLGG